MAQLLALGDIIRLRIGCYTATQAAINTIHYKVIEVNGASASDADAALLFNATLAPLMKNLMSVEANYQGVSVQRIYPGTPTVPQQSVSLSGPGLIAGTILPTQVSGIISFRTALAGRSQRGRMYIPFPAEDSSLSGIPVAAYETALGNLAAQLVVSSLLIPGTMGPDNCRLQTVLWHRATNSSDPINAYKVRAKFATQRKRGEYGARNIPPF